MRCNCASVAMAVTCAALLAVLPLTLVVASALGHRTPCSSGLGHCWVARSLIHSNHGNSPWPHSHSPWPSFAVECTLRPLARLSTSTAQQLESTSTSNSTTPRRRATHTTRHARTNKWTTRIRNLYRSTSTAAAAGKPRRKGQGRQRPVAGAGGRAARVGAGVARGGRHPCRGFFGFPPPCPFRQRHGRRLDLGHAPQCCTYNGEKKNEVSNQRKVNKRSQHPTVPR